MSKLPSLIKGWFNPTFTAEQRMLRIAKQYNEPLMASLVKEFNDDLFHFLISLSDKQFANDILQITWIKVIEKRHLFTQQTSFKSWLYTLARHSLIDELRRQNRWQYIDIEDHSKEQSDFFSIGIEEQTESEELLIQFNISVANLPFEQREAFILQKDGFNVNEIANICRVPTETIKSRLRYARTNIKRHLENTYV